jgi:hypothetical protein
VVCSDSIPDLLRYSYAGGCGRGLTQPLISICPSATNKLSTKQSHSWCRCRKRHYPISIKRLLDARERRGDISGRVATLVLPKSNGPRVTSNCASKIRLREPSKHTSGSDLASRNKVAHALTIKRSSKGRHRLPFVRSIPTAEHRRWCSTTRGFGHSRKTVRSNAGEEMGRIIDVIVGRARSMPPLLTLAGSSASAPGRSDWNALDFAPVGKPDPIVLELTRNQVRLAPPANRWWWSGQQALVLVPRGPGRPRAGDSPTSPLLGGALSSQKRVPTTPSAGFRLMQLVETLTLSRTKTQVNPPAAVPDIEKAHA